MKWCDRMDVFGSWAALWRGCIWKKRCKRWCVIGLEGVAMAKCASGFVSPCCCVTRDTHSS